MKSRQFQLIVPKQPQSAAVDSNWALKSYQPLVFFVLNGPFLHGAGLTYEKMLKSDSWKRSVFSLSAVPSCILCSLYSDKKNGQNAWAINSFEDALAMVI